MATLLNSSEVFYFANVTGKSISKNITAEIIESNERFMFLQFLDRDLYTAMLADKVNYSSVADWSTATAYTTGQTCKYLGVVYKATANSTNEQPYNESAYWIEAPKFTDTCFEALWVKIRRWLCLNILIKNLARIYVQVDDRGANRLTGQNFEPATERQLNTYTASLQEDADMTWRVFIDWLQNETTCQFSGYSLPCLLTPNSPRATSLPTFG
jgi:hypothetical protein